MVTTCCLSGEVPRAISRRGEKDALFWSDYYIELQRHAIPKQEKCNTILPKWAKKYQVKVIATNNVHFVEQIDNVAQDVTFFADWW